MRTVSLGTYVQALTALVLLAAIWLHYDQPWIWARFKRNYLGSSIRTSVPVVICGSPLPPYPTNRDEHCFTAMGSYS
ncbi:hypothetical protein BKA63DRAFT_14472 [Paraphoma chrysanthemicola]|nr:hypothetical protein BKA63DRAFT_14472 [Paraphoma chrysanthemicola]